MTTKWADGFEDNAAADIAADYSVTGVASVTTGRRSGTSALRFAGYVSNNIRRTIGGTEATVFQSCALKFSTTALSSSSGRHFMRFMEGATIHIALFLNASGAIEVYRGNFTTLLGTTSGVFVAANWNWVQVKCVINDTTGSVEIRDASGSVLIALTGIDTKNGGTGYVDVVSLGGVAASGSNDIDCDDWHVWDSTGSICNTWTNDTRVDHKLPNGAGNNAQFTPSAGANDTCVDEANYNTTDYVESSTAGHKDSYAFADISHTPPNIFSVLRTAVAQKDDAGARSLKMLTRQGGTDYSGSAVTLNQGSYSRVVDVQEVDPATSAAWTQSGVNSAEFGFENV